MGVGCPYGRFANSEGGVEGVVEGVVEGAEEGVVEAVAPRCPRAAEAPRGYRDTDSAAKWPRIAPLRATGDSVGSYIGRLWWWQRGHFSALRGGGRGSFGRRVGAKIRPHSRGLEVSGF